MELENSRGCQSLHTEETGRGGREKTREEGREQGGAGTAWATEAEAEACDQRGRAGGPGPGAGAGRVTRGAAGSCIAQKRRPKARRAAGRVSGPRTWASSQT